MRGLFVTGTDTNVGKTVVAAMLAAGWRDASYWKPIQCGVRPSTDRRRVARWAGLPPSRLLPEAYCLALPASPHVAAAAENVRIERRRLALRRQPGPVIVEGAGGVLVPLNTRHTMLDLMVWLGLPVVLVARTQLGTINHTLLSLQALRRRGVPVAGLVLHGPPVATTTATLRAWGRVTTLIELPRLPRLMPAGLRAAYRRHGAGALHAG